MQFDHYGTPSAALRRRPASASCSGLVCGGDAWSTGAHHSQCSPHSATLVHALIALPGLPRAAPALLHPLERHRHAGIAYTRLARAYRSEALCRMIRVQQHSSRPRFFRVCGVVLAVSRPTWVGPRGLRLQVPVCIHAGGRHHTTPVFDIVGRPVPIA